MSVFLNQLKQSGHLNQIHMTVCNVGSRKLGSYDDYGSLGWEIFAPNLSIYGFDADADACEAANANIEERNINWVEKHIPLALGSSVGESTLYVTKHPMCSSLYPPNENYLQRFQGLSELVNLDFTLEIETTTLDCFCQDEGISEIDFLQIDVQGADLDVLKGASQLLQRSVLAVQIEVEFSHIYRNQPLFADVDTYLRSQGFTLFDLAPSYRLRNHSPIQSTIRPGQILWADAFYFRDFMQDEINHSFKTPENILKLASIVDILHFPDYALELLEYLTVNYSQNSNYNLAHILIQSLGNILDIPEEQINTLPITKRLAQYLTMTII